MKQKYLQLWSVAGQGLRHLFEPERARGAGRRVPKARPGRVAPKIIYSLINHHEN